MIERIKFVQDAPVLAITDEKIQHLWVAGKRRGEMIKAYEVDSRRTGVSRIMNIPPEFVPRMQYGAVHISFLGVAHHSSNWQASEPAVLRYIKEVDLIISEHHPAQSTYITTSQQNFFWERLDLRLWESGKPVLYVDPHMHPDIPEEKFKNVNRDIKSITDAVVISALATAALGVGMDVRQMVRYLRGKSTSRRQFLIGGGAGLIGMIMAQQFITPTLTAAHDMNRFYENGGIPRALSQSDMRNVYLAYTALLLEKRLPPGTNLGYIYGAGHAPQVLEYLRRPFELVARFALYTHFFPETYVEPSIFFPKDGKVHPSDRSWKPHSLGDVYPPREK